MRPPMPLVVFSDLDGTLLDHDTYDWAPARPALERLKSFGIPLVLASSKTEAEIRQVQADMGLAGAAAIVENGAGMIGIPSSECIKSRDYKNLRQYLDVIPSGLRTKFKGFGDMSAENVAQATGLTLEAAQSAKMRTFSEPGVWGGSLSDRESFLSELARHRVSARMGGRFLTLSFGGTKQDRMSDIMAHHRARASVALGDAPNDVEMLAHADYGFIIANPNHPPLPRMAGEAEGRIMRTDLPGPHGWNTAINGFLDRYDWTKERHQSG
mgnify:FL=1